MNPTIIFQLVNILVLPPWLLMIVAPNWHITRWIIKSKMIPVLLALVYLYLTLFFFTLDTFKNFGSLEGIKSLFSKDEVLLAGWIHYLAFDLFIGGWIWQNAKTRHVPHYWVLPALIFTFMLGPVGLLFYLGARVLYPPQILAVL